MNEKFIIDILNQETKTIDVAKTLLSSKEYVSEDELHEDIINTLLDDYGIYMPIKRQKKYVDSIVTPFQNLSYYYFPSDTSILYYFNANDSRDMLVENPELSKFINDANIIVKRDDPNYNGIYLSFVLPEHDELFKSFNAKVITKDEIFGETIDPLKWEYEDSSMRLFIPRSQLSEVLMDNPQQSVEIGGDNRESYKTYEIIYYNQSLDSSIFNYIDVSTNGEFEIIE